ncbi:MAG: hypothetical protein KMY54_03930 [Erysipelothrix sp.]|nr:hypothetical protein [Erysipelothrix sp.]
MTYAMTLDHSWEIMSEEEMYDVNGGFYMNSGAVQATVMHLASGSPISATAIATAIKFSASWLGVKFGALGGPLGMATGFVLGTWLVTQSAVIAERLFSAFGRGKGIQWGIDTIWIAIPVITGEIR